MYDDKDDEEKEANDADLLEDEEAKREGEEDAEDGKEAKQEGEGVKRELSALKQELQDPRGSAVLESAKEKDFDDAQEDGLLVKTGKFEKSSIHFTITIKSSDCAQKLLIGEVLKDMLGKLTLQDPMAEGIMKVRLRDDEKKGIWLDFEGVNITALFSQPRGCLDLEHIRSNDIAAIFRTYGVEAGRANIAKQIAEVFGHYGIEVNHRHLSLIADHMSQAGGFRAFNRKAMEHCASPLLAMSYETTMQFMNQACQTQHSDNMRSPTASIVLGLPPALGTGMVDLLVDLEFGTKESKQRKFIF